MTDAKDLKLTPGQQAWLDAVKTNMPHAYRVMIDLLAEGKARFVGDDAIEVIEEER